jgi:hypothetical protein
MIVQPRKTFFRPNISRNLLQEPVARRQTPAEILHESFKPFRTFRAGSRLRGS